MTTSDILFDSYPPIFRPNKAVDRGEKLPEAASDHHDQLEAQAACLPVIDFEHMNPKNLGQACREWGMFRLANHGVPEKLLSQLLDRANQLFALGFESKQALLTSPLMYFWGDPTGTIPENNRKPGGCAGKLDLFEGLHIAVSKSSQFVYEDPLLESFRSLLEEYGRHQMRLARAIFSNMAEDLNFPPKKSQSYLSPPTGILRVYRYLRCPVVADERLGLTEHTDSSVLTILHQDEVGGLQVCKKNKWLDVEPIHDTLIVNVGDMMQAMSNDDYTSMRHRVKVNEHKERISIGYFVFPGEDCVIESPNYEPFTYDDFRVQRELDMKTLGFKVGLPRFRVGKNHEP